MSHFRARGIAPTTVARQYYWQYTFLCSKIAVEKHAATANDTCHRIQKSHIIKQTTNHHIHLLPLLPLYYPCHRSANHQSRYCRHRLHVIGLHLPSSFIASLACHTSHDAPLPIGLFPQVGQAPLCPKPHRFVLPTKLTTIKSCSSENPHRRPPTPNSYTA